MAVLNWEVRDVAPSGPWDDKHKTQWTVEFRGYVLTVLRTRGAFECWIQKVGDECKISHTRSIRSLTDAQERVVEAAIQVLNGRAVSDEEYDAINLPLLVDLAETYDTAARRVAEAGLYGEELSLKMQADKYRREADEIRRTVARRLAKAVAS